MVRRTAPGKCFLDIEGDGPTKTYDNLVEGSCVNTPGSRNVKHIVSVGDGITAKIVVYDAPDCKGRFIAGGPANMHYDPPISFESISIDHCGKK